ncbi:histone transcription regulator 1 [Pluteus cervinus]|uniref:Histone transcription regulator 1 n=1 Tax=Pluteus cervinus TaxID=181527 RepID=A0ACD3A6N3_9AGAR|nr:histone transcription regulator 1 [Pluteus cervinus]
MHFTKPAWVVHTDSSKDHNTKGLPIFSVHVHPDGSRIATGGLDAKVRIWSTKPILNETSELSGKPPKSLCTLTMHTGPVLTVRWAHSGRWLASGSDDTIVMIWDLDPHSRGKVWGSDEVNVEGWKPLKRLPGHDSDVTDVAWSPGDRYLASVGLDSTAIIWCGFRLEPLQKLTGHQGFVKGVCWDPVGEFLATQSDDKTVKIWRTSDWGQEAEITKPFEDSPGSTFFRRLSWSPDGAHITASNATNNQGFVFIAAVITRNQWTSDISLVGHENTVEVATYNPHIFLRNPSAAVQTANICSVVALGADDRSVSVWQTKSARPLIVAKEVFERQIMDLSWSWDGLTLYAASSDGTLAVFNFDPKELEGIAPLSVQEQYLSKYPFTPTPIPDGFSHVVAGANITNSKMTPPPSTTKVHVNGNASVNQTTDFGAATTTNGEGEKINVLVAKRGKNKKRVGLASIPSAGAPLSTNGAIPSSSGGFGQDRPKLSPESFPVPDELPFNSNDTWTRGMDVDIDMDSVPIDSLGSNSKKRKISAAGIGDDDTRLSKARTLGGDRVRETVAVKEIGHGRIAPRPIVGTSALAQAQANFPVLPVLNYLRSEVEGCEDLFEARNAEDSEPTEVMFVSGGKQTLWLDYLPFPALAVKATKSFCAVAMTDGSVNVYSPNGRRLMPTLCLGAPCSMIDASKDSLLIITAAGQLHCWNMKKQSAHFPAISLSAIIPAEAPNQSIASAVVRPNGSPVLTCTNGVVYSYDVSLGIFVKLSEKWYAEGSEVWQGRQQRSTNNTNGRSVIATIESSISAQESADRMSVWSDKAKPEWWSAAMTLGHLETRLQATKLLDCPTEYKQALSMYAKRIADEGFRGKAEELIKELFGPVYWRPGRDDGWTPAVAGLSKRDLLRDVLSVFARSKTLTKLALDWQDTLKKAVNDD